jgi:hypothetical protein
MPFRLMLPALFAAVLATGALFAPSMARADDDASESTCAPCARCAASAPCAPPEPKASEARERWYGWQTLLVDGASALATPVAPPLGLGGYLLGAPIVHLANGHIGIAGLDLLLRVGLPAGGAMLACLGDRCRGDFGGLGVAIGLGFGALGAIVIDGAVLAREETSHPPNADDASRRPPARAFSFAPGAAPRREGGIDVGVTGMF